MLIYLVIALLAVVQSLFGIGLLVFGTPTLLLIGYSFPQALAVLLPASMAVSLMQLFTVPKMDREFAMRFMAWCLIPLAAALTFVLALHLQTSLNLLVAGALTAVAVLRAFPRLDESTRAWIVRHQRAWLLVTGLVHGLPNLGGGPLAILATSRFRDKDRIRSTIVYCYICFAAIQLCVLGVINPGIFSRHQATYAATSALVFLVVGRHVFRWVSAPVFNRLPTAFMASYAVLLGARAAGIF